MSSHNRLPPIFNSKDRHEWRREIEEIKSTFKLSVMPKWELKDVIGRGGFGTVFQVPNPERNGQLWAVKRVVQRESQIEPEKDGIIREIVTSAGLSQLEDNYFVKFFGWVEDEVFTYFIMEYIELGDLEKNLASPWTENDTKSTMRQLLSGLEIMHSNNITHRDLKPKNIFLISRDPVYVKIGDFGISKRVPGDSSTKLDTRFTTHGYTAPEVIMGEIYTPAVDLWSLGCILYRMINGERLFCADVEGVITKDHRIVQQLEAIRPDLLSPAGVDILTKLIVKEPISRLTPKAALQHPWIVS